MNGGLLKEEALGDARATPWLALRRPLSHGVD